MLDPIHAFVLALAFSFGAIIYTCLMAQKEKRLRVSRVAKSPRSAASALSASRQDQN